MLSLYGGDFKALWKEEEEEDGEEEEGEEEERKVEASLEVVLGKAELVIKLLRKGDEEGEEDKDEFIVLVEVILEERSGEVG